MGNKTATIIGCGNAGLTAAYHLSKIGVDVCLYGSKGFDTPIDDIKNNDHYIEAVSTYHDINSFILAGKQKINKLTKNIEEALSHSDILILPVPSFAQETLLKEMLPYLKDNHIVLFMPGNFASLRFEQIKKELGYGKLKAHSVDAISIPWATRIIGKATIAIMGIKTMLPMATFPSSSSGVIERLQEVMPLPLKRLENVLVAGLENINFGGHPLLTILSMGLLENFNGNFSYYKDCCSPATSRAVAVMEKERLTIGSAWGFSLKGELESMNELYNLNEKTVYDLNRGSETHAKIDSAPSSSEHRYITEDIPFLLVPIYWLGVLAKVDTPIITSSIHIANAFNSCNYFENGRNLSKMGISDMSLEDIKKLL